MAKQNALAVLLVLLFSPSAPLRAAAALFLEEPFGAFGHMNPTGHAAVYLSQVCADSPTHLRHCESGEPGVVISRYHRIGGYDWIAIPSIPYLYAVDQPEQAPLFANAEMVASLRDHYRRTHLEAVAPDAPDGSAPAGEWTQLVGAAYDRTIYTFEIGTTATQDEILIQKLNSGANRSHFNLLFHNCADFARGVINTYYPHATHRSWFADQGITTPKQVAESLVRYSRWHPDLSFRCFEIAQVPGSIPRSGAVRGVFESFLKSKKYLFPVAALHPLVTGGMVAAYLTMACCDHGRGYIHHFDRKSQPTAILDELQSTRATYAQALGRESIRGSE
ncbi:MAG TPA: hypothetical protein VMI94_06495 [Bryobacteraceae bacterium]|nr:hypothetical protein [Bryobacteraceae bacterium]